jgi:hypothetical protein
MDQVPGGPDSHMKEPGTITHDSEKGADVKRIAEAAATGAQIGDTAGPGLTSGSIRGVGIGGLSGIAARTLIAVLARGGDVRFEIGSGVEVSLNRAVGIDGGKVMKAGMLPLPICPHRLSPRPLFPLNRNDPLPPGIRSTQSIHGGL